MAVINTGADVSDIIYNLGLGYLISNSIGPYLQRENVNGWFFWLLLMTNFRQMQMNVVIHRLRQNIHAHIQYMGPI